MYETWLFIESGSVWRLRETVNDKPLLFQQVILIFIAISESPPLVSRNPEDSSPTQRLNYTRLIIMYTAKFEATDSREALQYYFLLRWAIIMLCRSSPSTGVANIFQEWRAFSNVLPSLWECANFFFQSQPGQAPTSHTLILHNGVTISSVTLMGLGLLQSCEDVICWHFLFFFISWLMSFCDVLWSSEFVKLGKVICMNQEQIQTFWKCGDWTKRESGRCGDIVARLSMLIATVCWV